MDSAVAGTAAMRQAWCGLSSCVIALACGFAHPHVAPPSHFLRNKTGFRESMAGFTATNPHCSVYNGVTPGTPVETDIC